MSSTPANLPNRPVGKPVFDFKMDNGQYCRVPFTFVSNDGQTLVFSAWAFLVDSSGNPVLDPASGSPVATVDLTKTAALSGVMGGTHTLYDGWVKYTPDSQTVLNATTLPAGWTSGTGAPTGTATYGAGYYDDTAEQGWTYQEGCLTQAAHAMADMLNGQLDAAQKLAALGLALPT